MKGRIIHDIQKFTTLLLEECLPQTMVHNKWNIEAMLNFVNLEDACELCKKLLIVDEKSQYIYKREYFDKISAAMIKFIEESYLSYLLKICVENDMVKIHLDQNGVKRFQLSSNGVEFLKSRKDVVCEENHE